jgi:hypothetical protein
MPLFAINVSFMEKIRHIMPYLQHKPLAYGAGDIWTITGATDEIVILENAMGRQSLDHDAFLEEYSLMLRPRIDLIREISLKGNPFIPASVMWPVDQYTESEFEDYGEVPWDWELLLKADYKTYDYRSIMHMSEWMIDFQDLIEQKLAIDINKWEK